MPSIWRSATALMFALTLFAAEAEEHCPDDTDPPSASDEWYRRYVIATGDEPAEGQLLEALALLAGLTVEWA